jgi:hypothetical protein
VRPHLQKITRAKWTDSVAQAEELARFASTNPSSYPQFLKKKKKKRGGVLWEVTGDMSLKGVVVPYPLARYHRPMATG